MVTVDDVRSAQALIGIDEQKLHLSSNLVNLQTDLLVLWARSQTREKHQGVYRQLEAITFDLWNICTLMERIEWTRQYAVEHPDFSNAWRNFASLDIAQFHVEICSLVDYAAQALRPSANIPPCRGSGRSYYDLCEWLEKGGPDKAMRVERLGLRASEFVGSNPWPKDLSAVRNAIVHEGSYTMVFGEPKDGTLFK